MANLACCTLNSFTITRLCSNRLYTQLVPIVFKAPRESYIETLGVLTFFLNMCAMVYDKNCIMMSLFEYAKPFGFFFYVFPVSGSGRVPYLKIVNFQSSDIRRNTEPG